MPGNDPTLDRLIVAYEYIKRDVQEVRKAQSEYVTKEQLEDKLGPIRAVLAGVGAIVVTLIGKALWEVLTK